MTKLTIPPMPKECEGATGFDRALSLCSNISAWGSRGWQVAQEQHNTAQREADLADELAEALEVIVQNGGIGPQSMFEDASDALAKHTAARQMNKEARNG